MPVQRGSAVVRFYAKHTHIGKYFGLFVVFRATSCSHSFQLKNKDITSRIFSLEDEIFCGQDVREVIEGKLVIIKSHKNVKITTPME